MPLTVLVGGRGAGWEVGVGGSLARVWEGCVGCVCVLGLVCCKSMIFFPFRPIVLVVVVVVRPFSHALLQILLLINIYRQL